MRDFLKRIGLKDDATADVLSVLEKIKADSSVNAEYEEAIDKYLESWRESGLEERLCSIGKAIGEHPYAVHLTLISDCALRVRPKYREKGVPDEIYYDTMEDISYKVDECKKLYGFNGIFPFGWYHGLLDATIFKLGRLEYAVGTLEKEDYKDFVKTGDRVYNCHIPSCGPLTYESVMDSLKKAYKFFDCRGNLVVQCGSWMLYPDVADKVFPKGSNLRMFYDLFDIVERRDVSVNETNLWRVFYKEHTTPLSELPRDTSLQRAMIAYFEKGGFMGTGRGFIVFDGEKIINKQ